ncbi:hypothetical protein MPSEU_000860900 [Mayamaea pseudoterrestris]|nr:hypothetical protein MPSEU_000860900 [Mayamaea pseudoterrestris]
MRGYHSASFLFLRASSAAILANALTLHQKPFQANTQRFPRLPFTVLQCSQTNDSFDAVEVSQAQLQQTMEQAGLLEKSDNRDSLMARYQKETVKTLKQALEERKLPRHGLKADLVSRLVDHDLQQQPFVDDAATLTLAKEDEVPDVTPNSVDTNHLFSTLKQKLHADLMRQSSKDLKEQLLSKEMPISLSKLKKDELAQHLTNLELMENIQVASYLCNDEDESDREEGRSLSVMTGITNNVSIFEPGKLPLEFVMTAIEHFRKERLINRWYLYRLLESCQKYFSQQPSLLEISLPKAPPQHDPKAKPRITVCGDVHGQFYDVLHIFELNGYPHRNNPYVFNGDFVDRGAFSVEVITTLLMFKLYDPDCIHLIRGNHETRGVNTHYGFYDEVSQKYNDLTPQRYNEVFDWLSPAAVINKKVFVVHGGIPTNETIKLKDIRKIQRGTDRGRLMFQLLWNDPMEQPGVARSGRGYSAAERFGPDVTAAFLKRNKLALLVRSHEVRMDGYSVEHDGKTITVFSAPNYCDRVGNKGAFIHFDKTLQPAFTQFDSVPHPQSKFEM